MKLILIAIAAVISIPSIALSQAVSQSKSCEQIAKELEARGSEVIQNLDKTGYDQLVADDAVMIGNNGQLLSKKQELETAFNRPPDLASISFKSKDLRIRVCTETSIAVTGKDVTAIKEKGESESLVNSYWFTRIYEKRRGRWQLIYSQLTDVVE